MFPMKIDIFEEKFKKSKRNKSVEELKMYTTFYFMELRACLVFALCEFT